MGVNRAEAAQAALLGAAAVAVFYFTAFWPHIGNLGLVDSDQNFFYVEAVRKAIQDYGVLPMWDPWHMGGMPLAGNPNSVLSPLYFPVFVFGTVAGLKISMAFLHWAGFMGAWLFARKLGLPHAASLCAALVWALCGLHASNLQGGWTLFWHMHLMPLAGFCLLMAEDDYRWAVPPGILIALAFMGGSPYPVSIFLPLFAFFAIAGAVRKKSVRPLASLALAGGLSAAIAGVKLFPALAWMRAHHRDLGVPVEGYSLGALAHGLLDTGINLQFPTPAIYGEEKLPDTVFYMAPEYGMYLGPVALILVLAGLFEKLKCKAEIVGASALLLLLCMGDYSPVPLSSWMRHLPVYDGMRVVMRFRWPLVLLLSVLAGAGAELIARRCANQKYCLAAIMALVSLNLYVAGFPLLRGSFPVPAEKVLPTVINDAGGAFYQRENGRSYGPKGWDDHSPSVLLVADRASFPFLMKNIGVVRGYEPFDLTIYPKGFDSPEYHGEAFIYTDDGKFINPEIVSWTPNDVGLRWPGDAAGTLYLNQNSFKGWGVCGGTGLQMVESGLVAARVENGTREVAFCYEEPHFRLYTAISAVSFVASLALCAAMFLRRPSRLPTAGQA